MGGFGSGRPSGYGGKRETDFQAVDVRQFFLWEGRTSLTFNFTHRGEPLTCHAAIEWTPCHYGGLRPWFNCPNCGRRARKLYGGRQFACRKCWGFHYDSQYDELGGTANRINRIRERLRRPRLHWNTRRRLEEQLATSWGKVSVFIGHLQARTEALGEQMGLNCKRG
jgi:Zn-finger protein